MIRMGEHQWEVHEPVKVRDFLQTIHILPNMVVVVRNGDILTEDDTIHPEDDIELIRVISGGFTSVIDETPRPFGRGISF